MTKFWCHGCKEFRGFNELFEDYDKLGYCSKCGFNIKGEWIRPYLRSIGSMPVDCAPTCENISLCEHKCVGYKVKSMEAKYD